MLTPFHIIKRLSVAINKDFPITIALIFSRIAAAGPSGVLSVTAQRELRLTPSQTSRSLETLSTKLGLIEVTPDPGNAVHRMLHLSPKGVELFAAFQNV
jgi:DNA-binding MarR family transcriptional regulator